METLGLKKLKKPPTCDLNGAKNHLSCFCQILVCNLNNLSKLTKVPVSVIYVYLPVPGFSCSEVKVIFLYSLSIPHISICPICLHTCGHWRTLDWVSQPEKYISGSKLSQCTLVSKFSCLK